MDERMELLISLGASAAANCVPCFEFYFKKATAFGLPLEEVQNAVSIANKVKTGSSIHMRKSIDDLTGCDGESDERAAARRADSSCCN